MNGLKKINGVGFFILIVLILFSLFYFTDALDMPNIYLIDRDVISFSNGWTWQGDGYREKFQLPYYFAVDEGEPLVIRNKIPYDFPNGAKIALKSYMQSVVVKIDGETVYAVGNDNDKFLGRDFSNFWAVIDIGPEHKGKTIEITLFSHLPSSRGYGPEVVIASGTGVLGHIFLVKGIGNVLAIFIIILGMVSIVGCVLGRIYHEKRRSLLYLGLSAIIIGTWFLGDSGMLQLLTRNTYLTTRITLLMTLISAVSFGLYIRETIPMKKKRLFGDVIILLAVINAIICLFLEYHNILGLRDTLPVTLVLIAVFSIYNMIIFPIEVFRYKNKKASRELRGIFVFIVFALLEVVNYYLSEQKGTSYYILIGSILYIVIAMFNRFKEYNEVRKVREDRERFEKMAYTDALTKGDNRARYIKDLKDIPNPEGFAIIQADTDRLKYINDYFGHAYGDLAIIDTYNVLSKNFAKIGKTYRIGGDEFAVIIKNVNRDEVNQIIEQVKRDVELIAEKRPYDFSVSIGIAEYDISVDADINATSVRADHKMYDDKKRLRNTVPRKMPAI